MEQKIAELQAQITELKELVGVREPKHKKRKSERQWEGMPETKPEAIPEPEKDLRTRIETLESDVKTIKEQIDIIFRTFGTVNTDIIRLKAHHPFSP